jgi:hypothetical protein
MNANLKTKLVALLLTMLCFNLKGYTQTPQGFTYQAVVRNAGGTPIANKTVGVRITLEDASHVAYYTETHAQISYAILREDKY